MKTTKTYLILEATRKTWGYPDPETGLRPVDSVRVVASRANRPATLKRDQVVVKVSLELEDSLFDPVTPSAWIAVPDRMALKPPFEAELEDANEVES